MFYSRVLTHIKNTQHADGQRVDRHNNATLTLAPGEVSLTHTHARARARGRAKKSWESFCLGRIFFLTRRLFNKDFFATSCSEKEGGMGRGKREGNMTLKPNNKHGGWLSGVKNPHTGGTRRRRERLWVR